MTAIRKTLRLFSMAALIVAVAALTGCSKEEIGGDGLTFTTTVQMPAGGTKALDVHGGKTFAVDDQIKVTYDGGKTAISEPLAEGNISNDGKSASFTFTLSSPTLAEGSAIKYEYPAAHEGLSGQDGTLATLASTYDYAVCNTTVIVAGQLPTNITLANQYAILKLNLKNSDGSVDITDGVRQLTVTLGGQTVTVNRTPDEGPVYVAVPPAASGTIVFYAAKGKDLYTKSVVSQTITAGHLYPVNLSMSIVEGALSGLFSVSASKKVYFSKGNLEAVFMGSGAVFTWQFFGDQWGCVGDAAANNAITGNGTVSTAGAVDLFGWSSTNNTYGIDNSTYGQHYRGDFRDWGTNAIYNGGNTANLWSTMSDTEWDYLKSHATWGMATVAGVCGLIILPDNYSGTAITSGHGSGWNTNTINASSWRDNYEAYGAVFLPAAGYRTGTEMFHDPSFNEKRGYYWSSRSYEYGGNYGGYFVLFDNEGFYSQYDSQGHIGKSVRLVHVAN